MPLPQILPQGHQPLVTHHDRQRHTGHNHHTGRRRHAAQQGHDCQLLLVVIKRHGHHQHVGAAAKMRQRLLSNNRNRRDHQAEQQQIYRENPARETHVAAAVILNHHHMELAGKTHNCRHRQQHLCRKLTPVRPLTQWPQRNGNPALVAGPEQADGKGAHHDKRRQFNDGLHRNGRHQAAVAMPLVGDPCTESDREQHQNQGRDKTRAAGIRTEIDATEEIAAKTLGPEVSRTLIPQLLNTDPRLGDGF